MLVLFIWRKPLLLLRLFVSVGLLLWVQLAVAEIEELVIEDEVPVFSKPVRGGEPIHHLHLGDEIRASTQIKNGFRIIQYKHKNRKKKGFVLAAQLAAREAVSSKLPAKKKSSFFVAAVHSMQKQASRELQTTPDSTYDVGEFSGSSQFFAMGFDGFLSSQFTLRAGLVLRKVYLEGDATQEGSPSVYKFALEQNYYGLLFGVKYRDPDWGKWSLMAELEVDKSYDQSLKVKQGPSVDDGQMKDVTNISTSGVVSYTHLFSNQWGVEPSLRLGSIVSAQPYILLFEGQFAVHYIW